MDTGAGCIFCEILAGRAPASFVAKTPTVSAFMDINPVTPGHLLVVSNDHFVGLTDTPPEVMAEIDELGQRCAAALRASEIRTEGINLFLADGRAALQEVFHVHLHVLPRYAGDGFRISADRASVPSRDDLDHSAAALREALPDRLSGY